MAKSTASGGDGKPKKPYPAFPLFVHRNNQWAKKIRGKLHYFGVASADPAGTAANAKWLEQKDALLAGRTPRGRRAALTIEDLCDRFLTVKERLKESGELSARTFAEYFAACQRLVDWFGRDRIVDADELTPDDFGKYRAELAKTRGPVALGNELIRVRMVFKFADDEVLIPRPIRFGQSFSKPAKRVYLQAKAERGSKMFEAAELRTLLTAATSPLIRASILLAINAAFGQNDLALVPREAIDLERGWVRFPRPKTGVPRRAKLWPETVVAIREAYATRREPRDPANAHLAFLAPNGRPLVRHFQEEEEDGAGLWTTRTDYLGRAFKLLMDRAGLGGRRGFYGLRHSFQTIADNQCRDEAAVKHVMGHTDDSMSANYRDRFEDHRLEAVAETVRRWLFGEAAVPIA